MTGKNREIRNRSYLYLGIASVTYLWVCWMLHSLYPGLHFIIVGTIIPAFGSWVAWVLLTEILFPGK